MMSMLWFRWRCQFRRCWAFPQVRRQPCRRLPSYCLILSTTCLCRSTLSGKRAVSQTKSRLLLRKYCAVEKSRNTYEGISSRRALINRQIVLVTFCSLWPSVVFVNRREKKGMNCRCVLYVYVTWRLTGAHCSEPWISVLKAWMS